LGEAIIAMVQDSEKLFDGEGNEHVWTGSSFIKIDKKTHINVVSYKFDGLYRRPPEAQAAYDTGGGAGVGGER
jgi:hypothetical protein